MGNEYIRVIPLTGHAKTSLVLTRGRIVGTGLVLRRPASRTVRWPGRRVVIPRESESWQ